LNFNRYKESVLNVVEISDLAVSVEGENSKIIKNDGLLQPCGRYILNNGKSISISGEAIVKLFGKAIVDNQQYTGINTLNVTEARQLLSAVVREENGHSHIAIISGSLVNFQMIMQPL